MKMTSKDVSVTALFIAIIAVTTLTPLGMIPLPFLQLNLVLVPILVCSQLKSLKIAFFVSTAFGIFSLLNAVLRPTLLYFAVLNPLVSILPRMFIGVFANLSYNGIKKALSKRVKLKNKIEGGEESAIIEYGASFFKKLKQNLIPSTVSAGIGVITNTVLFLGMVFLLYNGTPLENGSSISFGFIAGVVATNFVPEFLVAVISVPLIVSALEKAINK